MLGPRHRDVVEDLVRREVERCDKLSGFVAVMSVAGGTGSGVGTYLTQCLRDAFPKSFILNHLTWPYGTGEVCGCELLAGGVSAFRMLECCSLTFSVSGYSAELQLRADAGSPPPAVRCNSGAWERHVAQDLCPAAQQQTNLFHRCQQGDCSTAGQHPAACPHPEFIWSLQQEPFGWEAVFLSPHCLATCSLICWWL